MMKPILAHLILIVSISGYSQENIAPADLKTIIDQWEGYITYLDYQTNKPFTMPANLVVKQGKDENSLILDNIYPNEPKANNSEKIKLSKNGTVLNKHEVTLREELDDDTLQIQTEHQGRDDNKKATIRYTYIIGKNNFIIKKEVQFEASSDWIKRSEYNYKRQAH